MGNLCWIQAAVLVVELLLVVNSLTESGDDWENVMSLGQADGKSFKAIVQPLVEMAANSYRYPEVVPVTGWTLVDAVAPVHGGMHATLYQNDGDSKRMVLSFRGTDISGDESSMVDLCADRILWTTKRGTGPTAENCSQFSSETLDYYTQALDYTRKVMRNHTDSPLLLTGHSLGAGLALLVSATLDVSPSVPVVAFSAPGVAEILHRKSLSPSSYHAKRLFVISDLWDEIMRTSWEDQVGTTCLYPTPGLDACSVCFDESDATSTLQVLQAPSYLQTIISNEGQNYSQECELKIDRLPGFTDACWNCFLGTHILKHVMDLVDLGVKPICEFHPASP